MTESMRVFVLLASTFGVGATLTLSEVRWFRRPTLQERLAPFTGLSQRTIHRPTLETFRDALTPLAAAVGERVSRLLGVHDDLATRLLRARSTTDVAAFRMRQLGWAAATLAIALLSVLTVRPPAVAGLFMLLASPTLAFLLPEHQLATAQKRRQQQVFMELPVVSEQLAMLLGAGFSLGAALNRLSERNHGTIGRDLRQVCDRVRQGLSVAQALHEWATLVSVPELTRLVAVLQVGNETTDLGRLVSDEARTVRAEAQRRLVEIIDRRSQQVWIPVTVAALVPGVTFLLIPFLQALDAFSSS